MTNALRAGGFDDGPRKATRSASASLCGGRALRGIRTPSSVTARRRAWKNPGTGASRTGRTSPTPSRALRAKGSIRYSIDTPYLIECLALAYDTVWPLMKEDRELVERAQSMGLSVQTPADACQMTEEMLAALLQVTLDRGASSNLPRESQGALIVLRCLDRPDAAGRDGLGL